MVEMIWTKLAAPHAGIEPVSETQVRNGIFCCRDRALKWAHWTSSKQRSTVVCLAALVSSDSLTLPRNGADSSNSSDCIRRRFPKLFKARFQQTIPERRLIS